ncbi:Na(+)-translocating NADH-quinone reductasesubunit F [Striga asiatica]|uniref:Na(+)-translocating NADH-quinone reductasesubunit F n=1 Tax=Striga asiatica TaxID=4170 RepID=A0A5A7P2R6_STRAF|nr:Na(+)-translocating NADH-quinone reductasesubunit F [Striga asiatica]
MSNERTYYNSSGGQIRLPTKLKPLCRANWSSLPVGKSSTAAYLLFFRRITGKRGKREKESSILSAPIKSQEQDNASSQWHVALQDTYYKENALRYKGLACHQHEPLTDASERMSLSKLERAQREKASQHKSVTALGYNKCPSRITIQKQSDSTKLVSVKQSESAAQKIKNFTVNLINVILEVS